MHVKILAFFTQAVHALVSFNDVAEWVFFIAYASPVPAQYWMLSNFLEMISAHMNLP